MHAELQLHKVQQAVQFLLTSSGCLNGFGYCYVAKGLHVWPSGIMMVTKAATSVTLHRCELRQNARIAVRFNRRAVAATSVTNIQKRQ